MTQGFQQSWIQRPRHFGPVSSHNLPHRPDFELTVTLSLFTCKSNSIRSQVHGYTNSLGVWAFWRMGDCSRLSMTFQVARHLLLGDRRQDYIDSLCNFVTCLDLQMPVMQQ